MKIKTQFLFAAAALLLASCSTYRETGFLENFDQLEKGHSEFGHKFAYKNPNVDFSKYHSVIIDRVTFIEGEQSKLTDEDRSLLANTMRNAMIEELSKIMKIVDEPGEGVMRTRGALTAFKPANKFGNLVTTVVPHGRVVVEAQQFTTGVSYFSAKGSGEGELIDSLTGERLVAVADLRSARKNMFSSMTKWGEMEGAMKRVAADLRRGLEKAGVGAAN